MSAENLATPIAQKDEERQHPVAASWRPVLSEIVRAFVRAEYQLTTPIAGLDASPPIRLNKFGKGSGVRSDIRTFGNLLAFG